MTVLVLGSSGQIGSALITHLKMHSVEYITCDLVDGDKFDLRVRSNFLDSLFGGASFVYFLAFDVGGSSYLSIHQSAKHFLDNNTSIMYNVFYYLDKYHLPFVFASTQMSNMGHSSYATLKRLGEHYTSMMGGRTVKFWNTYGVETDPQKTHVITDFLRQAKFDGIIKCRTDGTESRQFLHVDDCSRALICIRDIYNDLRDINLDVTIHKWTTIKEVALKIASIYNCTVEFSKNMDEVQRDARNEPTLDFLSYWKPTIDLETGIRLVNSSLFG